MLSFEQFPKIDAHFHATGYVEFYAEFAKKINLRYININTDAKVFPSMQEQEIIAKEYMSRHPEHFAYISSFEMKDVEHSDWLVSTIRKIGLSRAQGAVGVKIWKNIGMEIIKPCDNSYLMVDDPLFAPLFDFFVENKYTILAHLGEPKNCWLPLDEMTSDRNRLYYTNNPEFHAYLHPEIPHYDKQIKARDAILERYPDLVFVGAHLGSLEWSIDELSVRMDKYPNFFVDVSSRVGHLQIQSNKHYDDVRDFMIKYEDRILYGTDAYNNPDKLISAMYNDWQYFTTNKSCTSTEVTGSFRGLILPEETIHKLYFENAKKVYTQLKF